MARSPCAACLGDSNAGSSVARGPSSSSASRSAASSSSLAWIMGAILRRRVAHSSLAVAIERIDESGQRCDICTPLARVRGAIARLAPCPTPRRTPAPCRRHRSAAAADRQVPRAEQARRRRDQRGVPRAATTSTSARSRSSACVARRWPTRSTGTTSSASSPPRRRSSGDSQHPNVVQIFDAVADPSEPYLVMEYVPGVTLRRFCRADTPAVARRRSSRSASSARWRWATCSARA